MSCALHFATLLTREFMDFCLPANFAETTKLPISKPISSHLYLYSAFYNTECINAASQ